MTYTVSWTDYEGDACVLTIKDTTATDTDVTELKPGTSPFTTSEDDDSDPMTPIRTKSGTISVIVDGTFDISIQSSHQWRVTMTKADDVKFTGWLKGETVNQQYTSEVHELELDCIDDLEALDTWLMDDSTGFGLVTIKDIVVECLDHICLSGEDHAVVVPASDGFAMWYWTVSRYNFFSEASNDDEEEENLDYEAKSCKEVMEIICKFFGWSLREIGDVFYFCYAGETKYSETTQYYLFKKQGISGTVDMEDGGELTATSTNHLVDEEPGKKKITIRAVLNKVDDALIPSIEYEKGKVAMSSTDTPEYHGTTYNWLWRTIEDIPNVTFNCDYTKNIGDNIAWGGISGTTDKKAIPVNEDYWDGPSDGDTGSHSSEDEDEKTNYSFHNRIYATINDNVLGTFVPTWDEYLLAIKGKSCALLTNGGFQIKFSRHIWQDMVSPLDPADLQPTKAGNAELYYNSASTGYALGSVTLWWMLKVGEKYWNGTEWTTTVSYFSITSESDDTDHALTDQPVQKSLSWNFEGDGWCIPITEEDALTGLVEARLVGVTTGGAFTNIFCMIHDLDVSYCQSQDLLKLSSEQKSSHTYSHQEEGWTDEMEVSVNLCSNNNDCANYGQLIVGTTPIETMTLLDGTVIRPEQNLLNKYVAQHQDKHTVLTVKADVSDDLTPRKYYMMNGTKMVVLSSGKVDWLTGRAEIVMRNV